MKRKWLAVLITLGIFLALAFLAAPKGERMPLPDALLLYRGGEITEISKTEAERICGMVRIKVDTPQEMAIDPGTVAEIKSGLALEFVYSQPRLLE